MAERSAHDSRERAVEEATAAGLQISDVSPYVRAQVGNWSFSYSDGLWFAYPFAGCGMPLAHALHLYDTPMPGAPWGVGPLVAGEVVRAWSREASTWSGERPQRTVLAYMITGVAGLCIFADYVRRPGLTEAVIRSEP